MIYKVIVACFVIILIEQRARILNLWLKFNFNHIDVKSKIYAQFAHTSSKTL